MSVLHTITRAIPPPSVMTMPSVGIDISETSLKYVQFAPSHRGDGRLGLTQWGNVDVPSGILQGGTIKDTALLAEILTEVRQRTECEYVRLSLPEERAYIFETAIDNATSFSEIRGLLEFSLEENVPIPPRETVFDFDILPTPRSEKHWLSVTAYARDTVQGYYEVCQKANLLPLSFEVEAQAIARAVLPPHDQSTTMLLDFGKTRTGVGIVHCGILLYTSTIDIGGAELSSALRRQLGDISEARATELKNTQGLVRGVTDSSVYDALLSTLSAIQNEVATRIDYWNTRADAEHERPIETIILCGGSANLRGLPGYFTGTLDIPTKRANVWGNAFSLEEVIPPIDRNHSYGYATAIGLALAPFCSPSYE